jgi:hypothetical protein
MKKIIGFVLMIFFISVFSNMAACTSDNSENYKKESFHSFEGLERRMRGLNGSEEGFGKRGVGMYPERIAPENFNGNLTDEQIKEREKIFEDMMKKAVSACDGKSEGDSCSVENFEGESRSGTCLKREDSLFCMQEKNMYEEFRR